MLLMKIPSSLYSDKTTLQIEVKGDSRFDDILDREMSYVITVQNFQTMINIKPGAFLHGSVSRSDSERFYFYNNEKSSSTDAVSTVCLSLDPPYGLKSYKEMLKFMSVSFWQKPYEDSVNLVSALYSIQDINGKMLFHIKAVKNSAIFIQIRLLNSSLSSSSFIPSEVSYSLLLDKGDQLANSLIYLPDSHDLFKTLMKGERSIFEYKVSSPGFIFFQLHDCFGEFQLNGTNQWEKLLEERYDVKVTNPIEGELIDIIKCDLIFI